MSAPFPNCQFKVCDLPGQCRAEGKCHHPLPDATKLGEEIMRLADEYGMESRVNQRATLEAKVNAMAERLTRLYAANSRLAAALAEAIQDAERYRLLRNSHGYIRTLPAVHMMDPERLDEVIDAAIASRESDSAP